MAILLNKNKKNHVLKTLYNNDKINLKNITSWKKKLIAIKKKGRLENIQ